MGHVPFSDTASAKAAKLSWEKPMPASDKIDKACALQCPASSSWKGNCSWRFVKNDTWKKSATYLACAFGRMSELQKGYQIGTNWLLIQWAIRYVQHVYSLYLAGSVNFFKAEQKSSLLASWLSPNRKKCREWAPKDTSKAVNLEIVAAVPQIGRAGVGSSGLTPATPVWSGLLQPGASFLRMEAGPLSPTEEKHTWRGGTIASVRVIIRAIVNYLYPVTDDKHWLLMLPFRILSSKVGTEQCMEFGAAHCWAQRASWHVVCSKAIAHFKGQAMPAA